MLFIDMPPLQTLNNVGKGWGDMRIWHITHIRYIFTGMDGLYHSSLYTAVYMTVMTVNVPIHTVAAADWALMIQLQKQL